MGAGLGPGHWPSGAQPSSSPSCFLSPSPFPSLSPLLPPRGNQTCHPSAHTKAALGDLAVIEARVWERQTLPPQPPRGPGLIGGVGSGRVGCPTPTPRPHTHTAPPPLDGLPWLLPGTWEAAEWASGSWCFESPISHLAPAWGLCTLTSCPPFQLRCHLLNSAPPRSSRPPRMLAPSSPPSAPPDITLLFYPPSRPGVWLLVSLFALLRGCQLGVRACVPALTPELPHRAQSRGGQRSGVSRGPYAGLGW